MFQKPTLSVGFLTISEEKRLRAKFFLKPTLSVGFFEPKSRKNFHDANVQTSIDTTYRRKWFRKTAKSTLSVVF